MTSRKLKSAVWLTLAASAVAVAAGPPPGKGPGGGEETGNNLSVPAIMIGGTVGNVVGCGNSLTEFAFDGLSPPTGNPTTSWPIDTSAYYYVQGVSKWQSDCAVVAEGTDVYVLGAWGDNLTGDAKLKAGSPIRVEILLFEDTGVTASGYEVVKLEPDTLDRLSAYGTLATGDGSGGYQATAQLMTPVVYDSKASMTITNASGDVIEEEDPINPEINATGKVVYGFNLRVPEPGQYTIEFKFPNVTFNGCDVPQTCTADTATLHITVIGGGGSGGSQNKGKGRNK